MSQASSSTGLNRRSSTGRNVVQAQPLAVVAAGSMATGFDPEAVTDNATGLPLIFCPDCNDVRVFSAITKSGVNEGRRYFKCPRKTHVNVSEVVKFALVNLSLVSLKLIVFSFFLYAAEMHEVLVRGRICSVPSRQWISIFRIFDNRSS